MAHKNDKNFRRVHAEARRTSYAISVSDQNAFSIGKSHEAYRRAPTGTNVYSILEALFAWKH